MSSVVNYEYCCWCEEPTGRAGLADDSLYLEDDGPYCRECYEEKIENDEEETMTKHTPGPWRVTDTRIFQDNPLNSVVAIASCNGIALEHKEHQANARLIAAAPETAAERDRLKESNACLLEAAKIAEAYLKQIGYKPVEHLKIIIDAIRKAEWESDE